MTWMTTFPKVSKYSASVGILCHHEYLLISNKCEYREHTTLDNFQKSLTCSLSQNEHEVKESVVA